MFRSMRLTGYRNAVVTAAVVVIAIPLVLLLPMEERQGGAVSCWKDGTCINSILGFCPPGWVPSPSPCTPGGEPTPTPTPTPPAGGGGTLSCRKDGNCIVSILGFCPPGWTPSPDPCPPGVEPTPWPTATPTPIATTPGRTGRILDRPTYPPHAGGPVNYVQGPAPMLLGSEVVLFAAAGHCCMGRAPQVWEGVFVRWQRRWYPLFGSQDWGTSELLDEHEMTYPSVVYWSHPPGLWSAFYASTLYSTLGREKRVTVGYAMTGLWPMEPWPVRFSSWLEGAGHNPGGAYPIAALVGSDRAVRLWVHDTSANAVVCWRLVWDEARRHDPIGTELVEVARFVGHVGPPPRLTDIARAADGSLYALESTGGARDWESTHIAEWRSVAEGGNPPGRIWRRTGRTWAESGRTLFDGGYLRDEFGGLITPSIIVANIGDGRYADSGAWELWWWAEDGASVPPDWWDNSVKRAIRR